MTPHANVHFKDFELKVREVFGKHIDLSTFPHIYLSDGILGALNYCAANEPSHSRFFILPNEFSYLKNLNRKFLIIDESLATDNPTDLDIFYASTPFSGCGNLLQSLGQTSKNFKRIWIDLAYFGSHSPNQSITLPLNTERVFFSFSKTYGLFQHRIGIMFSKVPDSNLNLLMEKRYFNWTSFQLAFEILNQFSPFHLFEKYNQSYRQLCEKYGLSPADSILMAHSNSNLFDHWKSSLGFNRVPTGYAINKMIGIT